MLKILALASALLCLSLPAEARHVQPACVETGTILFPSCMGGNFLVGIRSIRVTMKRERHSQVETGRPQGCPARRWCGCYMAAHKGINDPGLWVARNWARIGHAVSGPIAGAIVVWRHHVGEIRAVDGNRILVLSGNDGRRVRERWRTTRGVIAYRVAG